MARVIVEPIEPALISSSVMVLDEIPAQKVLFLMNAVFEVEKVWIEEATRKDLIISGTTVTDNNNHDVVQGRLVAWKTNEPFLPNNLFFRTIDTSRLLPMHLADFRVQIYAHPSHWDHLDNLKDLTRTNWRQYILEAMMHELVLLRNMHDCGGGDIPIIVTRWTAEFTAKALDYWVELSKGQWSDSERNEKYTAVDNSLCRRVRPCFPQADLVVRSLLTDPAVGYVPPFIIFYTATKGGRAIVLFTDPSHCPLPTFLSTFPPKCASLQCEEVSCGMFNLPESRCLMKGSQMVRKGVFAKDVILCNLWVCKVAHDPGNGTTLSRCQRCKEALYCSVEHQRIDWHTHKRVCEAEHKDPVFPP